MVSLHIDSYFVACPEISEGKEVFEQYALSLLAWKDANKENSMSFYFSKNSINTLYATNKYPFWEDLKKSIKTFSIDYIQDKDLNLIAEAILNKSKNIENELNILDVLFENSTIQPLDLLEKRTKEYQIDFLNILSLMSLMTIIKQESNQKHFLVTKNFLREQSPVKINSYLQLIEPENIISSNALPLNIESNFQLVDNLNCLVCKMDHSFLLVNSENTKEIFRFSLQAHTLKIGLEKGIINEWNEIPKWNLGKDFIETAFKHGFLNETKKAKLLLRSITEALLNIDSRKTHALRLGKSGGSPQITKNDFCAFRRDIDYEYHLHFWKGGNTIEFASVVVHNDMSI